MDLTHPADDGVRVLPGGNPPPSAPSLGALLAQRAASRGHQPFVTFYDDATGERTELSYATFDNWVAKTANLLVDELDLERGDRVATLLGTHWTAVVVSFACWRAGCSVAPLDADDATGRGAAALAATGARAAFVREDVLVGVDPSAVPELVAVGTGLGGRLTRGDVGDALPYAEEVLAFGDEYDDPGVGLNDEALFAVPPSTGAQAGVRLTQGNLLAAAEAAGAWGLGEGDRLLCGRPAHLVDGLVLGHLAPFAAGGSVVLSRPAGTVRLWRRAGDERASLLLLSPAALEDVPEDAAGERLRGALVPTGAAQAVLETARRRLPVAVGHGVVEATCASTLSPLSPDDDTRAWLAARDGHAVGAVTARAAVAALDGDGAAQEAGSPGRLAIRGPVVMAGYDRADLDEEVFASGWFATTERGFVEEGPDGRAHVFVTGPVDQAPGSGR